MTLNQQNATGPSHSIVIGGSMAGLLAARVLLEHFDQVMIVERDEFPDAPQQRKGVPQARHAHVLLTRGQRILNRLFPGIDEELTRAGAPMMDWIGDCKFFTFGGWRPRFPSPIRTNVASRDLLEFTVRRRLSKEPKLQFVENHDAVGLVTDSQRRIATGVRLRRRGSGRDPQKANTELSADLIVDASGRDSKAPEWLTSLGYPPPRQSSVNSFLGYASRFYQRPKDLSLDWKLLLVAGTPPDGKRGALILPIEEDRWLVTLSGAGGDYPLTDEYDFLEFSRSLPDPSIYDALKHAEPLSPIAGYRRTENRARHYEALGRWLERFVVIGDAVCAFNPVYGQGMTVAAQSADLLDRMLRKRTRPGTGPDLEGFSETFQKKLAKVWATPWLMATGVDLQFRETVGGRTGPINRVFQKYIDEVFVIGSTNPIVHQTFFEVLHFISPPYALLKPSVAALVVRRWAITRLTGLLSRRAALDRTQT